MEQIKYRKGYKYQLAEDYSIQTEISGYDVGIGFLYLAPEGTLTIRSGYAWDGPSGPALDTPDSMRGSLVHDALYQLFRMALISQDHRDYADELLVKICKEDGMEDFRADYFGWAVQTIGERFADPKNRKKVITAP